MTIGWSSIWWIAWLVFIHAAGRKCHKIYATEHRIKPYSLVTTRTLHYAFTVIINRMKFFGTPAPSTLDDGHLTLGKTLTTPRVSGHAAGAETPRAESLVLHYDTTVDSVVSGNTVVDTSGSGNNGTFKGNAAYSSSDRALTFDGTGDFVKGTIPSSLSGNDPYSFSMWVKPNTIQSGFVAAFEMGIERMINHVVYI